MYKEMHKPTMDYDTAFKSAANDPWYYADKAEACLDAKFGEGYAKKNPALLGTYMTVASQEFRTSVWCKALWEVAESLDRIAESD
jgi:predicted molibdopterin-dependent oxidoreductase YjgC|tara:strand:- start:1057 stop:1311 length:255 start_codon:yes stop_codon:yes gene_type:complete